MTVSSKKIGFAMTGSFCTFEEVLPQLENIVSTGADVTPIISFHVSQWDTRFMEATEIKKKLYNITGKNPIQTVVDAEPIGPHQLLDVVVIAPCTGNTIAKLANGITDTPVLMAAKSHLRNNRPVVLSIATNDGLGNNGKNIGLLLNTKNIYLVPFGQDGPGIKSNSLKSRVDLIIPTIEFALLGKQIQPVLLGADELI